MIVINRDKLVNNYKDSNHYKTSNIYDRDNLDWVKNQDESITLIDIYNYDKLFHLIVLELIRLPIVDFLADMLTESSQIEYNDDDDERSLTSHYIDNGTLFGRCLAQNSMDGLILLQKLGFKFIKVIKHAWGHDPFTFSIHRGNLMLAQFLVIKLKLDIKLYPIAINLLKIEYGDTINYLRKELKK